MRRDLLTAVIAVVLFTVLCGVAYPLLVTGAAQVVFPGNANGSTIERGGKVVGSRLLGQDFQKPVLDAKGKPKSDKDGNPVLEPDPRYVKERPSADSYAPDATFFANSGPNQSATFFATRDRLTAVRQLEGPYNPGLTAARVPVDAVTSSASGVDPHISPAYAQLQAARIAAVRKLPLARVRSLIDEHTDGRFLGVLGEPGVNVLELNLALDQEAPAR